MSSSVVYTLKSAMKKHSPSSAKSKDNSNKIKFKISKKTKNFKILRNYALNHKDKLLSLENTHKSAFAQKILNEILPPEVVKETQKMLYKGRRKYSENDKNSIINKAKNQILSSPKVPVINAPNNNSNNNTPGDIPELKRFNFFQKKSLSNIEYISSYYSPITEPNAKDFIFNQNYNGFYLLDNLNDDNNDDVISKSNSRLPIKKKTCILQLRNVPFSPPKKIFKYVSKKNPNKNKNKNSSIVKKYRKNFELTPDSPKRSSKKRKYKTIVPRASLIDYPNEKKEIKNNIKIKKIPKPKPQKLYLKKCNLKNHFFHEKFISKFLTPVNHFMSHSFKMTSKEYDDINKKIHDSIYAINNNDYSVYLHKRKKQKYQEFLPPRIPNISKIMENKYYSILTELKDYKFKI